MERKLCNWVKDDEGQSQKGHKRDKEEKLERCFLQQAGQCECEESETASHVVSYRKRYSSHRRKRLRDRAAAGETFFLFFNLYTLQYLEAWNQMKKLLQCPHSIWIYNSIWVNTNRNHTETAKGSNIPWSAETKGEEAWFAQFLGALGGIINLFWA